MSLILISYIIILLLRMRERVTVVILSVCHSVIHSFIHLTTETTAIRALKRCRDREICKVSPFNVLEFFVSTQFSRKNQSILVEVQPSCYCATGNIPLPHVIITLAENCCQRVAGWLVVYYCSCNCRVQACKGARVELYTAELICFNLEAFPSLCRLLLSFYRRKQ